MEHLRAKLEQPLLVSDTVNVRYLCGLVSSNAALLVESQRIRLFADFRYAESARAVKGVEFVETERDLFQSLSELLDGRVGFEASSITYERHARLHAGGVDLVPTYGLVEELRALKDDDELEALRRASAITSAALEKFAREKFVGRTERELAWRLDQLQRELGGEAASFAALVASGPNSARPHTKAGERKLEPGETVIVDTGCMVEGYCSDCTRTFATGPLPEELRRAYEVCLDAQLAGLAAVRPGASGPGADAAARDKIDAAGFGDAFRHGLGHGIGLLLHEAPRLARESRDTLQERNVVTVEPGIYLSGVGGVRIEDLVVVQDGEPEILTSFTKDLISVD